MKWYDFSEMLHETDLSRLDLNLLTLFDTVRREGHVGRAADRLNLSPSAVSHGLARLRRMLDDPLFLRSPKGVVLTDRAQQIADPVSDILARIRAVVSTAEPFDPGTSTRRFTIGAPDAIAAMILPALLQRLQQEAPGVDLSLKQVLPDPGEVQPHRAWRGAFADLDARSLDLALLPVASDAARFASRLLFTEDFVIVTPKAHPFLADPSLAQYLALGHVVVSQGGDPSGLVDQALAADGPPRRVALTVPNFMMALAAVAVSGLVSAVPRRFAALHAARFALQTVEPPLPLPTYRVSATLPEVALADRGTAWLLQAVVAAGAA